MKKPVRSRKLFEQARQILPGGVDSPVRAFQSVGGIPLFVTRGSGAVIHDVDGNRFIDYVMSWGPLIHGHAPAGLVKAIAKTARLGTSFGAPSPLEHELGEHVRRLVPSMERVRFVSSGTEAAMSAARVARAFTGRDKIVKFAGCYHGHADSFLVKAGSGATTLGVPTSPGVAKAVAADTLHRPLQRPRLRGSAVRRASWRHRGGDRRADRRQHGGGRACGRLPGGPAGADGAARHPADFRRGDLGVPRVGGRGAVDLRHHAGPHVPGQDHRRRPAGRRLRRARRHHGHGGARGPGLPGGHAVGEPAGDDRGTLGAEAADAAPLQGSRPARIAAGRWIRGCRTRRRRARCR